MFAFSKLSVLLKLRKKIINKKIEKRKFQEEETFQNEIIWFQSTGNYFYGFFKY